MSYNALLNKIRSLRWKGNGNPNGTNYLLAIGINDYKHLPQLHHCAEEALDLVDILHQRYFFEEKHIITLLDHEATYDGIYDALYQMVEWVGPNDNFLLYFSGQSEYDAIAQQAYWMPVEARAVDRENHLSDQDIVQLLSAINSHHTLVLADACFSETLLEEDVAEAKDLGGTRRPSRLGLGSRQAAIRREVPYDYVSPFADSLIQILRNNKSALGVEVLRKDVETVQLNPRPAFGPLGVEGHQNGQFVFYPKVLRTWPKNLAILLGILLIGWFLSENVNEGGEDRMVERPEIETDSWPDLSPVDPPAALVQLPEMVEVEGSSFYMGGCMKGKEDCFYSAKKEPQNLVRVKPFFIGKYEVTSEEFCAFLNEEGNQEEGGGPWLRVHNIGDPNIHPWDMIVEKGGQFIPREGRAREPVVYPSWYAAVAYCQWLSRKTGEKYRLPTEAEWEFAARGGNQSRAYLYAGSNNPVEVAQCRIKQGQFQDVGGKKPNELGLYDMSGNVSEWCQDCANINYRGAPTDGSAWETGNCEARVTRGGFWGDRNVGLAVSDRRFHPPIPAYAYVAPMGFRVVREVNNRASTID